MLHFLFSLSDFHLSLGQVVVYLYWLGEGKKRYNCLLFFYDYYSTTSEHIFFLCAIAFSFFKPCSCSSSSFLMLISCSCPHDGQVEKDQPQQLPAGDAQQPEQQQHEQQQPQQRGGSRELPPLPEVSHQVPAQPHPAQHSQAQPPSSLFLSHEIITTHQQSRNALAMVWPRTHLFR